jgi:photosystem II stability/assembly factor-like uncharacterized protein
LLSTESSGLPTSPPISYNAIVIDPKDSQSLFLLGGSDILTEDLKPSGADTDDMFTVYHSKDGGVSWENLNDGNLGAESGSIKGIAVTPIDPGLIFAGGLNGVFLTLDNGKSWRNLSEGLTYTHTAGVSLSADGTTIYVPMLGGGVFVGRIDESGTVIWDQASNLEIPIHHLQILPDPKNSNRLFASAYPGGVFRSEDTGESWQECNFGLPSFEIMDPLRQGYYALDISRTNPKILYLGVYNLGIYISRDGGNTWILNSGENRELVGKGIFSLVIDRENPETVFVSTEEGIYRTDDGGKSWSEFNQGLENIQIKLLHQASDMHLYAGSLGYGLFLFEEENNKWVPLKNLENFGTRWAIWDDRPLYQYTTLLINPGNPDTMIFGTFPSGIYKSIDKGDSWNESNIGWTNDGVFSLVYHPEDDNIVYAGTYNGVNRSLDGGDSWEMWDKGWPAEQWVFSIDFDARDPNTMVACSKNGENEGTGSPGFHGTVMKSTDGGASWFEITNGLELDNEFYEIIIDRFNPDIYYLASQHDGVLISYDAGESWQQWNEGLTNPIPGSNGNNVTDNMLLSPDGAILFFGSNGSGVFRRVVPTIHMAWE